MGLFSSKKEGGLMDVIRCDEEQYLVWKWRPSGDANTTNKENSIRYGSSLVVKDGEVAVFFYKQGDDGGTMQDFIVGPYNGTIKTANFPILTSIVGLAFGGESPFVAEIYFMNLQSNNQIRFGVPYFDVFDSRFLDFGVPFSARGTITFNLTDYKAFIKLQRLVDFDLDDFSSQIKDSVIKLVKNTITNITSEAGIPVVQIERKIVEINEAIKIKLEQVFFNDFGVNVKRFDLSSIEPDKESQGYVRLLAVTADQHEKMIQAQTDISIKNLEDTQRINAANLEDTLNIQREGARLHTQSNYMGAHALNIQGDVLGRASDSLGAMGSMGGGGGEGGGGGMNMAGMMVGMGVGGAMGGQMSGMMNNMGQNMNNQMNTPPALPVTKYMLAVDGQQSGPFAMAELQQLCQQGQFTVQSMVWKEGMACWETAGNVQELAVVFIAPTPPPMPGMSATPPPIPGAPATPPPTPPADDTPPTPPATPGL